MYILPSKHYTRDTILIFVLNRMVLIDTVVVWFEDYYQFKTNDSLITAIYSLTDTYRYVTDIAHAQNVTY